MMNTISWTDAADKISGSLQQVVDYIPNVFTFVVIILLGILFGWAVQTLIVRGLKALNLKPYIDKLGLKTIYPAKFDFIEFLGDLAQWIVIIAFLLPALEALNISDGTLSPVSDIVSFLPKVIIASVIFLVGVVVADFLSRAVEGVAAALKAKQSRFLADMVRWLVVIAAFLLALNKIEIVGINILDVMTQGLVYGFTAAFAIAFGFGGQDVARDILQRFRKNLPK
ncbi:hypothetical protein AUK11_00495 [bacterium CG2_30_37_16]|nr:MAG: hypothetical protein AUK11_00495 [bacterium CG2_30_37_16]PIP30397.1 MAG: hypothetical protein COX25_04895 [bacterium (Candidatus Howlettbacteria) CG23_combo_of_CG06-09_8_20_14_all_37_9]PIX98671.1 MAG: hypothetical protein COZ22_04420 [bacterium (Candidatus Howlettbacteria) CG_4_10_14_3_um_filter_37_10]PJB05882.1 MAG: hypothetical protein CO123_03165 [bacterium (Candidatus Howlettbacteria) CG_4_9_14_3_um_filter_37_10]